jgi:hypothetical protein
MKEVKFIEGDPPKARRGGGRGSKWDPFVETLRANPGRWALLEDEDEDGWPRSKASGVYRTLKQRYPDVDAITRAEGDHYVVYARIV